MPEIIPYIVNNEVADGKALSPLPLESKLFQEKWLQELLFKHPSILPVDHLDKSYAPLISIGREIANIDNLFISPDGLLCIVETKLWRNPEAHRTVVAQILDYAKTLSTWSYTKLDDAIKSYTNKKFAKEKSIYQIVNEVNDLEINEIEFQQQVQDCLANGRFALLIVGDKIYPAATQLADIIQSAPHLQFTMGFIELKCFKLKEDSDWPLIVVPSFVAKTMEVTRAVVKILYEENKPEVQVETLEEEKTTIGKTSPVEFIASLPTSVKDIFISYLDRWTKARYVIYWGKVGFSLRFQWKDKLTTVFDAYPDHASIFQDKRVIQQDLPAQIYEIYKCELMESPTISSAFAQGKRYIKYEHMTKDEVELLLNSTYKLIKGWNEVSDN